ncbi:MAG: CarD family transcriptional regulator [bacterium]|nr:CarD family transcriptional regulator [bacterium]
MPHFRTLSEISYELAERIPLEIKKGPLFFLAQDEKEARQLFELCKYWNPTFPSGVIISSYYQQYNKLTEKDYKNSTISFDSKNNMQISTLAAKLVKLGFERYPRAVGERSFAVRGNILDIVDRKPIRIEFDDNKISQLAQFNPSTQRTGGKVDNVTIYPTAYASHIPTWHEHDLTYEFITPKYYHKRFNLLKKDAEEFIKVKVATNHPHKVRGMIKNAETTDPLKNLEGFIIPQEHFIFLTDDHIFGREDDLEEFKSELDIEDLDPGDYVVHIDHGIALFNGMSVVGKDDYLELHYANNDKLYVPVNKTNRIEKYVGADNPKLTRLSGAQWESVIHKVKEDIIKTAKELLDMNAQRKIVHATAIPRNLSSEEESIAHDVDFELTPDQLQAIEDIMQDLTEDQAMNRLLCGDVGFGKTEVALRAAVHVVEQGGQVAFMAPTTILAQQHYETFQKRLEQYGIEVGLLSRLTTTKEQRDLITKLGEKKIDIVIGTHRLLSNDINIPKLQLIVVDEEQRFGVKHKEKFKNLRASAHVLTMTATPIPRTLNLALSGLQEISVLNTAPKQRQSITTIIEEFSSDLELRAIQEELSRDGQIYLVHNNLSTIYSRHNFIQRNFPHIRAEIAHGQMEAGKLIRIMQDFHAGNIDVLIASTIIENGLDIANANTIIIENSERFGLAQLYQLRGRIGRSSTKAYAYLLYKSNKLTPQAKKRLKALQSIKELGGGFELAMKDLEIRGVGDILGKKQHGHVQQIGLNMYSRLLQHAIEELKQVNN